MLRDPSQKQVTLRTCVAWQAGYRGDRASEQERRGVRGKEKERKKERRRGRCSEGGLGLIVTLRSLLNVASEGAPAASANFCLAQTCELLGAN